MSMKERMRAQFEAKVAARKEAERAQRKSMRRANNLERIARLVDETGRDDFSDISDE